MGIPGRLRAPDSAPRGEMDRMASSMKQVPNPLPKVLSRRGVGAGMEAAERESFERTQVRTGAGWGTPPVVHGWGIPQCPGGDSKGVGILQAQGRTEQGGIWCGGQGDLGRSGTPGPSRLAWGRGQGGSEQLARSARCDRLEPVPAGQGRGHGGGERGRNAKRGPNGRGVPSWGRSLAAGRGPLGVASVAAESGALSRECEGWGALYSPLDHFRTALTFPPSLASPSLCL